MKDKKIKKDFDISQIFADEEIILSEVTETKPKNSILNDNSHMHKTGKEGVDLDAGFHLTQEDIQNFTNPMTFKEDDNRTNDIYFLCKSCKNFTNERPQETKKNTYRFICGKCNEQDIVWGTKISLENQYKLNK